MAATLKDKLADEIKTAMRARDKARLQTLRLMMAEIKRREIDEQINLDEAQILAVLNKMLKQRRDAITQFQAGGRQDLVDIEQAEVDVLQTFMPKQLADDEIEAIVKAALAETGATSLKDMGKLMGVLKPKLAGQADMGKVGAKVKQLLETSSK